MSSPVAALWQRSTVIGLLKPESGITPITPQESCTKLVEADLCQHRDKAIRRALGPHKMGAGTAADAQLALDCLRAAARHEDTAEMCSADIANAFGTLHRKRVLGPLETDAPFLLPYFCICMARNGIRSVDEGAQWLAPARDTQRSPRRITTVSDSVCPYVWNRPRRTA